MKNSTIKTLVAVLPLAMMISFAARAETVAFETLPDKLKQEVMDKTKGAAIQVVEKIVEGDKTFFEVKALGAGVLTTVRVEAPAETVVVPIQAPKAEESVAVQPATTPAPEVAPAVVETPAAAPIVPSVATTEAPKPDEAVKADLDKKPEAAAEVKPVAEANTPVEKKQTDVTGSEVVKPAEEGAIKVEAPTSADVNN